MMNDDDYSKCVLLTHHAGPPARTPREHLIGRPSDVTQLNTRTIIQAHVN